MAFDPNEPRDELGRWTEGQSGKTFVRPGHPMVNIGDVTHADAGKMVAERAAEVARRLGFPVEKMTITDTDYEFELNGQKLFAGGTYHRDTDSIELRANRLTFVQDGKVYPNGVAGVAAHEIEHARFQGLMNDYHAERDAMEKDPDYVRTTPKWEKAPGADDGTQRAVYPEGVKPDDFMRPDGTLKEPYASRYPVYTKYTEIMQKAGGVEGFAKTDGVSNYSKEYWVSWANGKTQTDSAFHETLAEIGRLRYEQGRKKDAEKDAHEARVAEIKSLGGTWTDESEKEWRENSSRITAGFTNYHRGEVEGKKVYFMTTKGSRDRLSPAWSSLYKLVEWNWKRRKK